MTYDEHLRSHLPSHGGRVRRGAVLVGGALVALGLAALVFEAALPLLAGLGVALALWLSWITFEYAIAPLEDLSAEDLPTNAAATPPAFVDTQASWWTP